MQLLAKFANIKIVDLKLLAVRDQQSEEWQLVSKRV